MKNNTISGGTNNIIAGSNITISSGISNTFIWSDLGSGDKEYFEPTTSGAFYINTKNGVGINETNPQTRFDSKGAVKL
jgi:hypothetical protein